MVAIERGYKFGKYELFRREVKAPYSEVIPGNDGGKKVLTIMPENEIRIHELGKEPSTGQRIPVENIVFAPLELPREKVFRKVYRGRHIPDRF